MKADIGGGGDQWIDITADVATHEFNIGDRIRVVTNGGNVPTLNPTSWDTAPASTNPRSQLGLGVFEYEFTYTENGGKCEHLIYSTANNDNAIGLIKLRVSITAANKLKVDFSSLSFNGAGFAFSDIGGYDLTKVISAKYIPAPTA